MSEPATIGTKRCTGPCGEVKHVLAFSADKSMADGMAAKCRACAGEDSHRSYIKHAKPRTCYRLSST